MQGNLIHNLYHYIRENNPDLLMDLEARGMVTKYLSDKVTLAEPLMEELKKENKQLSLIEIECMDFLTKDLRPSRYKFICGILNQEFESRYNQLSSAGLLKLEVCKIIKHCGSLFKESDAAGLLEENKLLRFAVEGKIAMHFIKSIDTNSVEYQN